VGLGRFELPTVRSPAGGYEPDALTELLAIHALSYRPSLSQGSVLVLSSIIEN